MIRFLVRAAGYVLLAGAFVTLVVDGTRSIASSALTWTSLSEALDKAAPGRLAPLQAWVETHAGALAWSKAAAPALQAPLAAVLLVLGLVLVRLAAAPSEEVGILARR